MKKITAHDIAKMIDLSLLQPYMTKDDVIKGCETAKKYDVASVCVKPCDLALAKKCLEGTDVHPSTVIGFPHGSNLTEVKVYEAKLAQEQGCVEFDMVMNIGRMMGGDYDYVENDIRKVAEVVHSKPGCILKVILENAYQTPETIAKSSRIAEKAGADFVKTSTGYAPSGAKLADLRIMRASTSEKIRIKAAGGVRSLDAALRVRAVGGVRFGCTRTAEIVEDARKREAAGTLVVPDDDGGEL